MNKLMIAYGFYTWLYFKTEAKDIPTAMREFESACKSVGINTDNMYYTNVVLRDENGNNIDAWPY